MSARKPHDHVHPPTAAKAPKTPKAAEAKGGHRTAQREAIRAVIVQAGRPLAVTEIQRLAKRKQAGLGIATVYRTIKLLLDDGSVHAVELPGQSPCYEIARDDHHHHFRCRACQQVFDVPGCQGHLEELLPAGFKLEHHELILEGLCATCA